MLLSCRTRDVHRGWLNFSSDCKPMFSCRAVGNKESFSGFLDLLKYVWRDKDTKLCTACCVHGAGGARGGVSGRRDGMAHVCGVCFSFIYLICFAFCSPQLLCIDGNWRQHLFSLFFILIPFFSAVAWEFQGVMFPTHVLYCSVCVRNPGLERLTTGLGQTTAFGVDWGP